MNGPGGVSQVTSRERMVVAIQYFAHSLSFRPPRLFFRHVYTTDPVDLLSKPRQYGRVDVRAFIDNKGLYLRNLASSLRDLWLDITIFDETNDRTL